MAKLDPHILAHVEWLGYVRPTGLVVSAAALVRDGAILNQHDIEGQRRLRACLGGGDQEWQEAPPRYGERETTVAPKLTDFRAFASSVLDWSFSPKGYAGTPDAPIPQELELTLPDAEVTLRPDYAVRERDPQNGASSWQLLVRTLGADDDFDKERASGNGFSLSPHARMERLLRHTGVPAGLLVNGEALRLISAPRGESSGWLDFRLADMAQTAGRPILSALRLLLSEQRLLALPKAQRLAALLADSRKFQNEVSEKLAEQVLHALYELLRGFQAADDASKGALLRDTLSRHPDEVYRALLTVILRLVFLLYAEERGMLSDSATFVRYYSIAGLHQRLREDAALYPDTMEQRYGAWAQLVTLFRMIHDGAEAADMRLPARHGVLFDPDRFPFLEGRTGSAQRAAGERIVPPLVPDGTIYRALEKLLVLDGERISYRALDVEQIGSVYETMMGFRLETATGRSIAIRAQKKHGAPTTISLDALLAEPAAKRAKWLQDQADRKLGDTAKTAVAAATSVDDLHAALQSIADHFATPDLVPKGAMVLQPSEERRRSGSHYTPRELTEPIVRTTLDPILQRLRGKDGKPPRPEAILDLKVCDPAMGSGAFLVEACRYLGDALIESWRAYDVPPNIPQDEDEVIYARRIVAQRCLYGVDRNPVAVDLAKMSLWLATLAKDHALTFLDHALRHGDSLVGLSRRQIEAFHWDADAPMFPQGFEAMRAREHLAKVGELRQRIREAADTATDAELRALWGKAQAELAEVRLLGDLVIAAWFDGDKKRERETKRQAYADAVIAGEADRYCEELQRRRHADPPLVTFHWEIEFPEVFERENPGFDAFVGNPPFLGGRKVRGSLGSQYYDWLLATHQESSGNADISAHFFRRAFDKLRNNGVFGLIATNTIAQGDTRTTGLRWICTHNGHIFAAKKRMKWPGEATVVISVIHAMKGEYVHEKTLDGDIVTSISAFLLSRGGSENPATLSSNSRMSFQGSIVLGMGFTFDDDDTSGVASPTATMRTLIEHDAAARDVIFPYVGGAEVNDSPTHAHRRFVIDFRDRSEEECRKRWPQVMAIVENRVKPQRTRRRTNGDFALRLPLPTRWWQHADKRPALYAAIARLDHVYAVCRHQPNWCVARVPSSSVFAESLVVLPLSGSGVFCVLQSRCHEIWTRIFGSSLGDGLRYTPSDCVETFPFPADWMTSQSLGNPGRAYYDFRAALMVRNNEGLTKTYNRFHDPDETDPDIVKLRDLHAAMDRAVLDAYGWQDIQPTCEFLLDYEIDEEEWGNKKKPWRYRWPDEVQEEVLARLLELNAERAREEAAAGAAADTKKKARKKASRRSAAPPGNGDLFS